MAEPRGCFGNAAGGTPVPEGPRGSACRAPRRRGHVADTPRGSRRPWRESAGGPSRRRGRGGAGAEAPSYGRARGPVVPSRPGSFRTVRPRVRRRTGR
ncbi:hypothetical protein C5L38_31760 [Streptomyces sp. WAC00288]|nr:hypothetical protein C5L38_31760 [Streptomyces sp. WAC00288]